MRNLIIAGLVIFLLYSNSSFRTYTIEGLQSITNFIKQLPEEDSIKKDPGEKLDSGISTY